MWEANARSKTIFRLGGIYEIRPTIVPENPLFREQAGVFWVMMGTRKIHGIQQIMLAPCDRSPALSRVSIELTNNVYGWKFYHPLGQPLALIPAQGVEEDTATFMGFVTQENFHNIKALHGPGSNFLAMHDHLAPHFTNAEKKRFRKSSPVSSRRRPSVFMVSSLTSISSTIL